MRMTAVLCWTILLLLGTVAPRSERRETATLQVPEIANLVLASASGRNLDTDDLICGYDLAGTATTAATAWYRNGTPLMALYMPFEGGVGNAPRDYSGNGQTAATSGEPQWSAAGGYDSTGAYEFDGGDDILIVPDADVLDVDRITVAAWVFVDDYSNGPRIVSKDFGTSEPYSIYTLLFGGVNKDRLEFRLGLVDQNRISVTGSSVVPKSKWVHLAATFNGMQVVLYVDGQADMANAAPGTLRHNDRPVHIGSSEFYGRYFDGRIDDVRIYPYALSADQIETLYEDGPNAIDANETADGDDWRASVTPFSVEEAGTACESDTLTIHANAAPSQPILGGPLDDETGVPLSPSLSLTLTDPDADSLTVTYYGRPVSTSVHPPFSLAVIPDTQHYTAGMFGGTPAIFRSQTRWIVDKRDSLNVAFVNHTGDCVNDGDEVPAEWDSAWTAMSLLEDTASTGLSHGLPYSMTVGNHDQTPNGDPAGTTTGYNRVFGVAHFTGRPHYGGHFGSDHDNRFSLFSASGFDFIVVSLEYDTWPDAGVLAWADSLLSAHSSRWAIVSAHRLIELGNPGAFTPQGQATYDVLKDNPNLFLMLCGHYHEEARRYDTFEGRTVHTVLADYQMDSNGGDGWLRVMKFYPDENVIRVRTYSPWLDQFEADADSSSQFTLPIDIHPLGGWEVIGTLRDLPSGSSASVVWSGLSTLTAYEWYATVDDGSSSTASPIWRFTTGSEPPVAMVVGPNGGERLSVGDSATIQWTATDDVEVTSVDLHIFRDGVGGVYDVIAEGLANSGSYEWGVTGPGTDNAFLKVIVRDGEGQTVEESSDAAFMIFDPTGIAEDRVGKYAFTMISETPVREIGRFLIAVPRRSKVRVAVYDIAGRQVAVLAEKTYEPGRHALAWDGSTPRGKAASGVYFVRMETESRQLTHKVVLVR
jgi:hypothetical protein